MTGTAPPGTQQVRFVTFPNGTTSFTVIVRAIGAPQAFTLNGLELCPNDDPKPVSEGQVVAAPFLDVGNTPVAARTFPNGTDPIGGVGGRPNFNSVIDTGTTT